MRGLHALRSVPVSRYFMDDLGDAGGRAEAFARKAFSFEDVLERFRTVFDVDKPAG